jgi:hypothetical protein
MGFAEFVLELDYPKGKKKLSFSPKVLRSPNPHLVLHLLGHTRRP